MWVSRYLVWFVAYSVVGWLWESAYCTVQERRWDNRGFLYGPLCPIYGTGVVVAMAAWGRLQALGIDPGALHVFVASALGSAVLEYLTSWALERLFHARWWDYSNMPLNVNGRICLPATLAFGLAGLLVVYVLYGPTVDATDAVAPVAVEAASLVLVAAVSVDATLTVSALTRFAQVANQVSESVNEHMDAFVKGVERRGGSAIAQMRDATPVRAVTGTVESVREAGESVAERLREGGTGAAGRLAAERERFAASVRAAELGRMSAPVRSAARRVRKVMMPQGTPQPSAGTEQLAQLWSELRRHRGRD